MRHVVMMFLVSPDDIDSRTNNLAFGKPTNQSSTHRDYKSRLAVDGVRYRNIDGNSCSHTKPKIGSWWQVDLGTVYDIRHVVITNRADCCGKLHNTPYRRINTTRSLNIKHK